MSKALLVRIVLFIVFELIGLPGLLDDFGTWAVWLRPMEGLFNHSVVSWFFIISGGLILTYPQWHPKLRDKMRPFNPRLLYVLRRSELKQLKLDLENAQTDRDKYKRQVEDTKVEYAKTLLSVSGKYEQQVEDKERELSDLRGRYEALQKEHGHAVLWATGQECKSRGLSVAVQYVRIEDSELAKKIRSCFAYYLQSGYKHPSTEHINLPFNNPSMSARIVIFSDSDVGSDVKHALNDYNLLGEKVANYEKSFAGKLPDVDIAIVVFPSVG